MLWMFCWKSLYSKIGKIHHKTLNVVYKSSDTYNNVLLQSNTISEHQKHLRFSMAEYMKAYRN